MNGFLVSMDDFGAGYSSLNSLKDLPLDVVKLDGELFRMTNEVERGLTVIRNTITMAKDLRMKVVAECIETREQVEYLREVGCDLIQGYYYAKPMPTQKFEEEYLIA
jgi:EAL domain-containing protein (putative c-di-GMP-specific phosphodiesterase class I)